MCTGVDPFLLEWTFDKKERHGSRIGKEGEKEFQVKFLRGCTDSAGRYPIWQDMSEFHGNLPFMGMQR